MNDAVIEAIVASEDKTFWTNEGVDFTGVMRAAWNNFTGGATQGASTITQQYARVAFDLKGATYNRKIREAVLAWKIERPAVQGADPRVLPELGAVRPADLRHRGGGAVVLRQDRQRRPRRRSSRSPSTEAMVLVSDGQAARPRPGRPGGFAGLRPDPSATKADEQNAAAGGSYVETRCSS